MSCNHTNDFKTNQNDDDLPSLSLEGSKWKLVGIVDGISGKLKELEPNGENYFILSFDDDCWFYGYSTMNNISGNYLADYETNSLVVWCKKMTNTDELPDGELYINLLNQAQRFCSQENELRIFFDHKNDFLLFNSCDCDCKFSKCKDKYDMNEKEFITTLITPDTVSSNSINKWIVENHTKNKMNYGEDFVLEYFNENEWIRITPKFQVRLLGYILHSEEIAEQTFAAEPFYSFHNLYSLVQEFNKGKEGRYRISRSFSLPKLGIYILCAEFEVI